MARISTTEITSLARFQMRLAESGCRGVLAHLVEVEGSHYRRPGARMIFGEDGRAAGSISGGCLEADLAQKCAEVLAEDQPRMVEYDLRGSEDIVWGTGLGCAGRVEILLSPLAEEDGVLEAAATVETSSMLATVLDSGAFSLGEQVLVASGRAVAGSPRLAESLAPEVIARAGGTVRARGSGERILLERIEPAVRLLVGGAGEDAVPLVSAARALGWEVRVFAPRPTEKGRSRFPDLPFLPATEIAAHASPRAVAVVATHNYLDDLEILRALVSTPAPYIGLLGAKSRVVRLAADCGDILGETGASRIFGPAGLDIGADSPAEIALSIVAEIHAVLSGRSGGSLRGLETPIHERALHAAESGSPSGELAPFRSR